MYNSTEEASGLATFFQLLHANKGLSKMESCQKLIPPRHFSQVCVYVVLASTYYYTAATATATATAIPKQYSVALKLIHPDSISDRAWAKGSLIAETGVVPDATHTGFLVNMSIGDPGVPQLLIMDTGSSLLWFQCRPCVYCIHQTYSEIYNPLTSSTYQVFPCDDCLEICRHSCNSLGQCEYVVEYMDNAASRGNLAIEKLTFETPGPFATPTTIPAVIFGCGHNNHDIGVGYSGILGLGPSSISLVSQLGTKFSYCIGSISDTQYDYNSLIIGVGAIIEGPSTQMEIHNEHYHVNLESITVGEEKVDIDPKIFKRSPEGTGGVVIDSGTTYTHLQSDAYESLSAQVQRLMDRWRLERVIFANHQRLLCYRGNMTRDVQGFPAVTLLFAQGADLVLDIDSTFHQVQDDSFCMSFVPSEQREDDLKDLSIIGLTAQQYNNIGYDLNASTISFLRTDCRLI